jgi:hypothetical protein
VLITAQQGNIVVVIVNPAISVGSVAPMLPLLAVIILIDFHAAITAHQPFTIAT